MLSVSWLEMTRWQKEPAHQQEQYWPSLHEIFCSLHGMGLSSWLIGHKTNGTMKSMACCKTAASPLLTYWRYCSLALSHRILYITDLDAMLTAPDRTPVIWKRFSGDFTSWVLVRGSAACGKGALAADQGHYRHWKEPTLYPGRVGKLVRLRIL